MNKYYEKKLNYNSDLRPNVGKLWSDNEENLLLDELNDDIDIETIAENHGRKKGGIIARQREIAYKMYKKDISIEEIIKKTKLDNESINKIIERKENRYFKQKEVDNMSININKNDYIELRNNVSELKNEINDLRNIIEELVKIIKDNKISLKRINKKLFKYRNELKLSNESMLKEKMSLDYVRNNNCNSLDNINKRINDYLNKKN
jgi:hypothetical protein